MKKIASLVVLLCALLSLPAQADDDAQPLIDKIIAAYGGEAAWRATAGMRQEGSTYSQSRHFAGKTLRSYQHPGKMSIDIRYSDKDAELRQLDGDLAWNNGKVGPDAYVLASRLQAYRLALPLLLLDHRNQINSLGQRDDENGHLHEGLTLELEQGLKIIMDVDVASGRIMGSWGMMEMDGKPMEFASLYEDFRQVDGRLLSFKESHYAMGDYIGYTLLEKVEFVSDFPAHTFQPAPAE
jgi:hypothetical protein